MANTKIDTKHTRKLIFRLTAKLAPFKWSPFTHIHWGWRKIHFDTFNPGFLSFKLVHNSTCRTASPYIWHRQGNPFLARTPPAFSAIDQSERRRERLTFHFAILSKGPVWLGTGHLKRGGEGWFGPMDIRMCWLAENRSNWNQLFDKRQLQTSNEWTGHLDPPMWVRSWIILALKKREAACAHVLSVGNDTFVHLIINYVHIDPYVFKWSRRLFSDA